MKKKGLIIGGIVTIVLVILAVATLVVIKLMDVSTTYEENSDDSTFSTAFIRKSHANAKDKNYMISPYSVEIALSMLRDGTKGTTYDEINKVAPKRTIKTLKVKDKVNVANAIFIKEQYKKDVRKDYSNNLKENYNADFIYDEFKTPAAINKWADKETNGMIKNVLDDISSDFVLGLANAIAMEEEWQTPFECEMTLKKEFTPINGKKYDVSMMRKSFDSNVSYYKDDEAEAVVMPYKYYNRKTGKEIETSDNGEQLEFIGILPNDINEYIGNLDLSKIEEIDKKKRTATEEELEIYVEMPKFEYSYNFLDFKKTLMDMGIKTVFSPTNADLSGMLDNHPDSYVDEAVHKSYVKVDESGTKAAAITFFGTKDNAAPPSGKEFINIVFDKPFIFIIKDTKTNEIAFFGVVYKPNKYEKTSCK